VKFSFERNLLINEADGSSILLASIADNSGEEGQKLTADAIETPDDTTVIFHLNKPDTTFLALLATATTSIVDEELFPKDALLADDQVIGSGPLELKSFTKAQQATFKAYEGYSGTRDAKAKEVFVQYYTAPSPLRQALENQEVDVAWRTLSATDLNDLASKDTVKVHDGDGSEFRYWVFQLGTEVGKEKAVRQAVANIIDRESITKNAYDGIKNPSYSIVPPGFSGQKDSFKEKWGETPNVENAKKILSDAGITTPVPFTLGYPPEHYGAEAVDEANELAKQLTDSGLFKVEVKSAEWNEYQSLYKENAYDLFLLGWYPDILDADNYLSPFIVDGGFFKNNYSNAEVNKLIDEELGATDSDTRNGLIEQLQDIVAEDVPVLPSWNGKNTAVALPDVNGVAETLDATYIFRLWEISKGGSGS
jgi:peptide/nickel transport system substrate-binding protein